MEDVEQLEALAAEANISSQNPALDWKIEEGTPRFGYSGSVREIVTAMRRMLAQRRSTIINYAISKTED